MSPEFSPQEEKSGKLVKLLLWSALLLSAAAGGAWFWRNRAVELTDASQPKVRSVLHLETFVLNLAGSDERAYLRAGIDIGLRTDGQKGKPEAGPSVPLARDTILSVLATARPEDLLTPQGKQMLKSNLLKALRERVPELEVEEVYFTEFLIQR